MYSNYAFVFSYVISVSLIVSNTADNLSYRHKKRELTFNTYPASTSVVNPKEYNYFQRNEINDPGYTAQHDNNEDKIILGEKNTNLTNSQNLFGFTNPTGQMFHLIYMLPSAHKRQQAPVNHGEGVPYQQLNGNAENLAYAGPHLFPTQLPQQKQNMQPLNNPIKNVNAALHNTYSNQVFFRPFYQNYIKDSKVATKMEAPFIPSQFLGYGQQQQQHLSQQQQQQLQHQSQQLSQQYQNIHQQHQQNQQQLDQQNQLLEQKHQSVLKPAPVYQQQENSPYQSPRLLYMAPDNIYNLYSKLN